MAERTDRQPFPAEGLPFLTLFYAAIRIPGANPKKSLECNPALYGSLADFRKNVLVSNGSQMGMLVDAPLFELVMRAQENGCMGKLVDDSPETLVSTYIGMATGILISPDYAYKKFFATQLAANAGGLLSRVFENVSNFFTISCLTALTIPTSFTIFGGSTWHLLGLTMTHCVVSNLRTPQISDTAADDNIKVKKYRTCWTLYVLNTYISGTLDRPYCSNDHDIIVSHPFSPCTSALNIYEEFRNAAEHAQMLRAT